MSPLEDLEEFYSAYDEVTELTNEYLSLISRALNDIHGIERSERYWNILIGKWLRLYISILYESLLRAQNTDSLNVSRFSQVKKKLLQPEIDTLHYYQHYTNKMYRTQLDEVVYRFVHTYGFDLNIQDYQNTTKLSRSPLKNRIRQKLKSFVLGIFNFAFSIKHTDKIFCLHNSYFMFKDIFTLSRSVKYQTLLFNESDLNINLMQDFEKRNRIKNYLPQKTSIQKMLASLISIEIPMRYVEGFSTYQSYIKKRYDLKKIQIILSANAWHFDEIFKMFAAECMHQNKTKLLGMQHGGNYGSVKRLPTEEYERSITDKFISWGWSGKNIIPLPASKLINHDCAIKNNTNTAILFTATSYGDCFLELKSMPNAQKPYYVLQKKFIGLLSFDVLKNIRVRPYEDQLKEQTISLWRTKYLQVKIEGWNVKLKDSLNHCKLYVCDHMMTTYIEALVMNIPTILFWNPDTPQGRIREEAKEYFNQLKEVNVLHDTPESAAQFINNIFPNQIDNWWHSAEVQNVREKFCNNFALQTDNPIDQWADFINNYQ